MENNSLKIIFLASSKNVLYIQGAHKISDQSSYQFLKVTFEMNNNTKATL